MEADKGAAQPSEPVLRREPRNPTNWIATIRLSDGEEIPCTVKDVSKSGAKIGVPAYQVLPQTFLLRIIGRDFLCMVKLAWRRGDYVGVRIERVGKVAAPAQGRVAAPAQGQVAAPAQGQVAAPAQGKAATVVPPLPVPPITDDSGSVGIRSRRRGLSSF